jgi:hypothetical protein
MNGTTESLKERIFIGCARCDAYTPAASLCQPRLPRVASLREGVPTKDQLEKSKNLTFLLI